MKTVIRPLIPRMEYGLRLTFRRIPYSFLVLAFIFALPESGLSQRLSVSCYNTVNVSLYNGGTTHLNLYSLTPMNNLDNVVATIESRNNLTVSCADIGTPVMVMITDTVINQSCMVTVNVEDKSDFSLVCKDTAITRLDNLAGIFPEVINSCLELSDLIFIERKDSEIVPYPQPSDTTSYFSRNWTFKSDFGVTDSCSSIIYQVRELIPPFIDAISDSTILLDESGFLTVDSGVFINALTDNSNCIESLIMTGSGIGITTGSGIPLFDGTTFYTFSCTDTGTYQVEIIATDCDQNMDTVYCQLTVDDEDICDAQPLVHIRGKVLLHGESGLKGVVIELDGGSRSKILTDAEGNFEFSDISSDNFSKLNAYLDDSWQKGLSVIDLKLIQNHILGKKSLIGWKLASADFNDSGDISALDLSGVRRTILGLEDNTDKNQRPWIFSDMKMKRKFEDLFEIWMDPSELYSTEILAAKRGDVNGDIHKYLKSQKEIGIPIELTRFEDNQIQVEIDIKQLKKLGVFQFSLDIQGGIIKDMPKNDNVHAVHNNLKFLYFGDRASQSDVIRFVIEQQKFQKIDIKSSVEFNSVLYDQHGNEFQMVPDIKEFKFENNREIRVLSYPNPAHSDFFIDIMNISHDEEIQVRIYDMLGNLIIQRIRSLEHIDGNTSMSLKIAKNLPQGPYLIYVQQGKNTSIEHIIKI